MTTEITVNDFCTLANAHRDLEGENPLFEVAREGVSSAMHVWLFAAHAQDPTGGLSAQAIGRISPSQIDAAVLGTGDEVFSDLYAAARPRARDIVISATIRKKVSTPALEQLMADGYIYDACDDEAAEDWLSRGAHIAEAAYRKHHPRKSPVMTFFENSGLVLPRGGITEEGRHLMAEELRRLERRRLPSGIEARLRVSMSTDWRVILCMLFVEAGLPFSLSRTQFKSMFGAERYALIDTLIREPETAHGKLSQARKLRLMPSFEEILGLPADVAALDPYLDAIRALSANKVSA